MSHTRYALLSVSDKTGLLPLADVLVKHGIVLLSTGGTSKHLKEAGLPVVDVAEYTGFPEMMDGRVKTLHPKIHGGLLGLRDEPAHVDAMKTHGIGAIDFVIVNLYPFEATVARGAEPHEVIENIDIGGPSMLRSAAKNFRFVTVVTEPEDYARVAQEVAEHAGHTTETLRRELAAKVYARTAAYDAAIAAWFATQAGERLPERMVISAVKASGLRYGENPHQQAALYVTGQPTPGVATATQVQGKELSFNNLNDGDAAFLLASELTEAPAVAIIKHANPCGVAMGTSVADAYRRAFASDPVSAFGGIIATNRPLDKAAAEVMSEQFAEVIIAPEVTAEAKEVFAKKTNLRVLETGRMLHPDEQGMWLKAVAGGFLVQEADVAFTPRSAWQRVSGEQPDADVLQQMELAMRVCRHVKSNAIVLVKDGATVGIGGGQTSRVDAVRIAVEKANTLAGNLRRSEGAILASDAFFPFADNIALAKEAGVRFVIQPGGSVRDEEVIAAAKEAGITMLLTGMRHFRH